MKEGRRGKGISSSNPAFAFRELAPDSVNMDEGFGENAFFPAL